jgi:hypothetical protein
MLSGMDREPSADLEGLVRHHIKAFGDTVENNFCHCGDPANEKSRRQAVGPPPALQSDHANPD